MYKMISLGMLGRLILLPVLISAAACASTNGDYRDQNMDFGSIYTVAVLPLANYSREPQAAERVRDVYITMLLASGGVYVLPTGEVAKGISVVGLANPTAPSKEEIIKLGSRIKVDGIITGAVREYGEVRSGNSAANVLSLSMQLTEVQTGKIVWAGASTRGGIGFADRLFGGGGDPLNDVTEKAVHDVIKQLF